MTFDIRAVELELIGVLFWVKAHRRVVGSFVGGLLGRGEGGHGHI